MQIALNYSGIFVHHSNIEFIVCCGFFWLSIIEKFIFWITVSFILVFDMVNGFYLFLYYVI